VDNILSTRSSQAAPAGAAPGAAAGQVSGPTAAERAKVQQLAQEFESYFLVQMLRQMRESLGDDESKDGLGASTMTDTVDIELSRRLTAQGGFGLARTLQDAIERQTLGSRATPTLAAGSGAIATPSLLPLTVGQAASPLVSIAEPHDDEPSLPLPIDAPVSSPFGLRPDPFTGARRFHAGVDIAAAYGREVPAAAAGRVVFAGEQGGYGNTVVVEHEGGIRTRYAHLSTVQVDVGARVDAGTFVGRVGSTGRSTGPHLHFEVLQDGQPVNPAVAATRYAGLLKVQGLAADLPVSQPSAFGVAVGVDDEDSGQ
jgi:murein DD-endopeptidase MepM/ murein hydrolase activator NlpD